MNKILFVYTKPNFLQLVTNKKREIVKATSSRTKTTKSEIKNEDVKSKIKFMLKIYVVSIVHLLDFFHRKIINESDSLSMCIV